MAAEMRLLARLMACIGLATLAGHAGAAVVVVALGGIREPSAHDVLVMGMIGGVPAAALAFALTTRRLLGLTVVWPRVAGLLVGAELLLWALFAPLRAMSLAPGEGEAVLMAGLVAWGCFGLGLAGRPVRVAGYRGGKDS